MSDTKNAPLLKEKDKKIPTYTPTSKEQEVVSAVFYKFRNSADERNQNFENFDGLNLIDYIDDSVRRYTTNVDFRDDIEDWQARVHVPDTRNKTIAILGKVAQVLPLAEFVGRGDEDVRKGQILTSLYEYSEELDDYEEFMVNILLEAIVKGTAVGYEGHERKETDVRDIKGTGDDITVSNGKKKVNRLFADIVRLEEFYPSSVGIRRIKDMPYCFWRNVIPHQKFLQDFAMYAQAEKVHPQQALDATRENRPAYLDYISNDVQEGQVEIIRYYNSDVDEFVIIANGIWLNPIDTGKEKEWEVSPLPFQHKELPFWEVRFEIFDPHFFYGKSLPDKLKSFQDVLNVLTNMLLDQSFLTIFKPILTNGFDSIEDDYLRPGRRTPVDTQGLSIQDAVQELSISTPTGWHQFILQYTRGIMEETSVDQVSSGSVGGLADRTPAQAIRTAAEGVASVLGLFGRFVKYGVKRKSMLRAKNILQFWTDPKYPVIEQVLGEGGTDDFNKAFNVFKINNSTLSNGKRGMKIIELFESREKLPTKEQLKARSKIFKIETKKELEVVALPADYIRGFDFDTKLRANPYSEQTKDADKALHLEKVRVYLSFFPDLVDKAELFAQTAEKMGDDPTKIMNQDALKNILGQMDEGAQKSMVDNGMSTLPQSDISNNTARGMMGGEQSSNTMQQLQSEMIG